MSQVNSRTSARAYRHVRCAIAALLLVSLLVVPGCFGPNHHKLAMEALHQGRPEAAVAHFRSALVDKPSLAHRPKFNQAYRQAQHDTYVVRARRAMDGERHVEAVEHFNYALALDAEHGEAAQLKRRAAGAAANMFYEQAVDRADAGDRNGASEAVDKTLRYQPRHDKAQIARIILDGGKAANETSNAAYHRGRALFDKQSWAQAVPELERAIIAEPAHLPARVDRARAMAKIAEGDRLFADANRLRTDKRLDSAIVRVEAAKAVRPHHDGYDALHKQLVESRNRAQTLLREAATAAGAGQWDQGLILLDRATAIFPDHPRAADVDLALRSGAAADWTGKGEQARQNGRPDAADAAYRKALRYMDDHGPAHRGLAATAIDRAAAAEKANRPGLALLWYTHARGHAPDSAAAAAAARLSAALHAQHRFAIDLKLAAGALNTTTAALEPAILARLRRVAPPVVAVAPAPANAPGQRYTAALAATPVTPTVSLVQSADRNHRYTIERIAANPRVRQLQKRVHHEQVDLNRIVRDIREARRDLRDARTRARNDPDDRDRQFKVKRLQRRLDDLEDDHERQARRVEQAHRRLADEPPTITVKDRKAWPYTVQTRRRVSELTARMSVTDVRANAPLQPISVTQRNTEHDKTTVNANPAIGLAHDPLEFGDVGAITNRLISAAAADAANQLVHTTIQAEAARLTAQAQAHDRANQPATALEKRVAAAVLLHHIDPDAADTALTALLRTQQSR